MATVRVSFPGRTFTEARQARLYTPDVGTLVLPWWPTGGEVSGLADPTQQLGRPGRQPVNVRTGLALPVRTYTWRVSSEDVGTSVEAWLAALRQHASSKSPTTLIEAAQTRGLYQITDLSWTELDHTESGEVSVAEVSITLTTEATADLVVGPVPARKPAPPAVAQGGASAAHPSKVRYGSRGEDVSLLQRTLNAKNGAGLAVDGVFGAKTRSAVYAWQRKHGLAVDGVVGPLTWASLGY